jgi:asparagine synthase (glutamine-hydrolysing)
LAVPLAAGYRGPLRERVRTSRLGSNLAATGMFNAAFLAEMVEHHQSGRRDYSAPIWTLLMFEAFLKKEMQA